MYFPHHMLPLLRNGQAKLIISHVIKIFQGISSDKMMLCKSVHTLDWLLWRINLFNVVKSWMYFRVFCKHSLPFLHFLRSPLMRNIENLELVASLVERGPERDCTDCSLILATCSLTTPSSSWTHFQPFFQTNFTYRFFLLFKLLKLYRFKCTVYCVLFGLYHH